MSPSPAAARPARPLAAAVRALRPAHWLKNGFVLAPLIFSRSFHAPDRVYAALWTAVVFSIAASAVYVWNDLWDAPRDRLHPRKRRRPIAAGEMRPRGAALLIAALCLMLAAALTRVPAVIPHVCAFLALNAAYTVALKRVPWLDLAALSAGFYLRVEAGAAAIHVTLSWWMLTATLALAFFLASLKRHGELAAHGDFARPSLAHYQPESLRRAALLAGVAAAVCYGLFLALVRHALLPTLLPVVFGLARYYRLSADRGADDSPLLTIARDPLLLLATAAWAGGSLAALW